MFFAILNFNFFHLGTDVFTGEDVTIKLEEGQSSRQQLRREWQTSLVMGEAVGMPRAKWYARSNSLNNQVSQAFLF